MKRNSLYEERYMLTETDPGTGVISFGVVFAITFWVCVILYQLIDYAIEAASNGIKTLTGTSVQQNSELVDKKFQELSMYVMILHTELKEYGICFKRSQPDRYGNNYLFVSMGFTQNDKNAAAKNHDIAERICKLMDIAASNYNNILKAINDAAASGKAPEDMPGYKAYIKALRAEKGTPTIGVYNVTV